MTDYLFIGNTWSEAASQLKISTMVTDIPGKKLNVGEKFKLTVRVNNVFKFSQYYGHPKVQFIDLHLKVFGSEYTSLIRPNQSDHHERFFDGPLKHSNPWSNTFEMRADREITNAFFDIFVKEQVAHIYLYASLDVANFFRFTYIRKPEHEIEEKPID